MNRSFVYPQDNLSFENQLKIISRGTEEILLPEELRAKIKHSIEKREPLVIKFGVDPTAPDLHLGHSVALRKLKDFQDLGHKVVLLIGDFTAKIGDPSQRSVTRPQLSPEDIKINAKTYTDQAFKILNKKRTIIDYNSRWFSRMSFEDLLKLAAKFTVARLLERDDFHNRFHRNISIGLHEFLYPVMQAYDSVILKADVEIGGTDQKFNMLAGREVQKEAGLETQVVITLPILEGTDGVQKMSKSLGNHIGLTEPPNEMFGKVMSIPDEVMIRYFKLATTLALSEIEEIEQGVEKEEVHPADLKRRLGREIVTLYWGKEKAERAEREFDSVFKRKEMPSEIPLKSVSRELLKNGKIWIVELLRETGLAKTNSEARRLIEQGGVKLNQEEIISSDLDISPKTGDILQAGKRRFVKIAIKN